MSRAPTHAFVGRTAELTELIAAFDSAAATSEPTFTLVSGDAGTGKTRLLEELGTRVRLAGGLVLVGSCVQVGDFGLPYLPVIDALRAVEADPAGVEILREESAVRPALARLLPQLSSTPPTQEGYLADSGPEGLAQGQLFEGLLRVLGELSATKPVLLVIEDMHWADRSTRDLMAFLARTLRSGRVAMVASYRTDDLHRRHPLRPTIAELARLQYVHRIGLPPFNRSELALLLDELAGSAVDAGLVDRVFTRSEGNAFFAEELMRAGRARDAAGLPDELADVLLSRVEELGPAGRRAVRAAAVAGRRVGHDLLVEVAGESDTEDGLRDAVEIGLLTSDGETYAFRHALFQEAVYADLLPGERVRLHARFAELLAAGSAEYAVGGPAELAHHRLASHDLAGALAASVDAATAAESMAAPAEALRHLEQAVGLLDRLGAGGDRLPLLMRAADAASASGDMTRAMTFGKAAVAVADEVPDDVEMRVTTRERLARYQLEADVCDDEPSRTALELLPPEPPTQLRARVLATRARRLFYEDPAATVQMLAEATTTADQTGAHVIAADALITLNLFVRRGFLPDHPVPSLADALERTTGPDGRFVRMRALRFQASQSMEDGDLLGALAAAGEGVALSAEAGLSWSSYGLDLRLIRGWALAASGDWDEVLEEGLRAVYAPTQPGREIATQAVAVLVGRGSPDAEPLLTRLRGSGDRYAEVQLDLSEIDLRRDQGRPADAVKVAQICRARLEVDGWGTERLLLAARHAAALADLAQADRSAGRDGQPHIDAAARLAADAEARPSMQSLSGPYGTSWSLRLQAEADRAADADTAHQWDLVRKESKASGRVQEQVYAATQAARLFLVDGDRDSAAELLRTALGQARRLGAAPMVAAIDELALRGRLRLRPDRPVQPVVSTLTPREKEVLVLVAKGLPNRQIGKALFISDKTASVHLSHIMAKLGATTRTEAVSLARQRGLLD